MSTVVHHTPHTLNTGLAMQGTTAAFKRRMGDFDPPDQLYTENTRFLAEASHDLRQPVHALGLYIAELRRKITGTEQRYLIGRVEQSVDAIRTLIDTLLDLSRLDAGMIVPNKESFNLSALINRVAADFEATARGRHISLHVHATSAYTCSDPVLLTRILSNLISNALHYTPAHGRVLIAIRRRGPHLVVEVRDNGIGIDPSLQSEIFREFVQIKRDPENHQDGLGLGLSIVKRLARLLEHGIELRSVPGRGSVFSLKLEAAHAERVTQAGIHIFCSDRLSLTGKKLLIIDSDESILDGTTRILSSWGCQVHALTSFNAAQKHLKSGKKWDLIISDYQVDALTTGVDVIDSVRNHLKTKIPGILISADTNPAILKYTNSLGYPLLHKPVRPAKLRSLLHFLLSDD